jgi:NADP-dependent 3-hydroxy acid dehydrogenase YdfG
VRVVNICPGATSSELVSHTTDQSIKDGYEEWRTEIGGVLEADDVARTVLFAYEQPQNMCIRQIVLAPTKQAR